jgi:hypothetical protein
MTRKEIDKRLDELGIPKQPRKHRMRIRKILNMNAVVVVRNFPELDGTPWKGPIWSCHDASCNVVSVFEHMGIIE